MKLQILPVIHFLDSDTAFEQARVAHEAGADGVFLISHMSHDERLPAIAAQIKSELGFKVGLNFLNLGPERAFQAAVEHGLDMVWGDNCGVSSKGCSGLAHRLLDLSIKAPAIDVFASVAFKYQAHEPDPGEAARLAGSIGFIPTTSGAATGSAPDLAKVTLMSDAADGKLAIASGMTVENVSGFAPHLTHILVSTGVSVDDYRFDPDRLGRFIEIARRSATRPTASSLV